jgi:hypothetical protein
MIKEHTPLNSKTVFNNQLITTCNFSGNKIIIIIQKRNALRFFRVFYSAFS